MRLCRGGSVAQVTEVCEEKSWVQSDGTQYGQWTPLPHFWHDASLVAHATKMTL